MQARASKMLRRKEALTLAARHFTASSGALAQAPAVSTASSGGGLFSFFLGKTSVPGPPMSEPLAGVPEVPAPVFSNATAKTQVTTLPNGLKIASEDSPRPSATVGIYINSGSVWETPWHSGASHLLERMAYKSTANRTHFRVVREIEAIGANMLCSASREQMAYTADVIQTYVPEAVEILADTVRNSLFNEWEVQEQAKKLNAEVASLLSKSPESFLMEALHSAAFTGALANPLIASPASLARLNGQALFDFVANNYTAPRIVVAAAGVDHEDFKGVVEPLFNDLPGSAVPLSPQSQYVGGDWRMAADSPVTTIALGFEFAGGWKSVKDSITAVVLQSLMGGGNSFSAGGPGKGMYSRLYTRVLNKYPAVQACTAFSSLYDTTGLIGIYATSESGFVPNLVDIVVSELTAVAAPGGVTDQELQRAKNATVSSVLMNLESRSVTAEDIGRQILTYGERKDPQEFIATVNSITTKDITALVQKVLKTPLTFAAYGDVVHVPRFDQVASRFG